MDNQWTTHVTVSDPFLGVMEMSFTYRSDVQHADERETHINAISSAVMKYIAEHDHLDLTGYSKKTLAPSPSTQEPGNTICVSKNTLRHMYDEWLQFTKLRDECVANMQDHLKQLKPAKKPSFVVFCETHLDVTKHVFECETCGFHAKNPRALSAHRKGKNCVQLRTNHVSDTASSEDDENEDAISHVTEHVVLDVVPDDVPGVDVPTVPVQEPEQPPADEPTESAQEPQTPPTTAIVPENRVVSTKKTLKQPK